MGWPERPYAGETSCADDRPRRSLRAGAEERKRGDGLKAYYVPAKIPLIVDKIDL